MSGYEKSEQKSSGHSDNVYWAAEETNKIGDKIVDRIEAYYKFIRGFGRLPIWHRCYNQYYHNTITQARLLQSGVAGEFTLLNVNNFHNIIAHLVTLTVAQRPEFDARAINSDLESLEQCIVAEGLLDYYMRTKGLDAHIEQAVRTACIFGEGFVRVEWDAKEGKIYGQTETGSPVYEGDIKISNFTPLDVIRDYSRFNPHDQDWQILRTFKNKWDLTSRIPESEDIILASPTRQDVQKDLLFTMPMLFENTDDIIVYEFYHKVSDALPQGRMVWINGDGDVLCDGPLPYKEIPIYRISYEDQLDTPFGVSVSYELMPIQEQIDNLYSTIATNQNAFGTQNIIMEQGTGMSAADVYGGLRFIQVPKGAIEPKALELCATPTEVFNHLQYLTTQMETLSGVNSVARGQPEASLKSGAALALVQSMAIQFNMPMQLSYTRLVERLGVSIINILKDYAATPRVATIIGKSKRPYSKSFTSKDLEKVDRVEVDLGNPVTQTMAGKVNLAETLLDNKLITNAKEYIQVMMTGTLDPAIEGDEAEMLLIRSENEDMEEGKPVNALFTDNHAMHILEHKVVLASPEARVNPKLVQEVTAHLQQHLTLINDPKYQQLYKLLNEPGGQPPAPPPGQGAPPGAPPMPPMPPPQAPPQQMNAAPMHAQVAGVNLPSGPRNPLTHQKVMLPAGAGRNSPLSGQIPGK